MPKKKINKTTGFRRKLRKDLTGCIFGKLKVIKVLEERDIKQNVQWECKCTCGNIKIYPTNYLKKVSSCGCNMKNYIRDYSGKTHNSLKILNFEGKNKYNCLLYKIECKCGKYFVAEANDILSSKIRSCGCRFYNKLTKKQIKNSLISCAYSGYKMSARSRKIKFDIDKATFESYILKNCEYCGSGPSNIKKVKHFSQVLCYNGLDRVDNKIGYQVDNIKTCCKNCNLAKRQMTLNEFYQWINRLYKNMTKEMDIIIKEKLKWQI